ncbi:ubiE/COQ5 methyltransferase family protein [Pedobacter sp. ok626]|uniref:class I SAM-dependent methyltransferase n=1 Tax=Pedobacter sp. ok626 TaxID=1761882 RepID=UPI000882F3B1|nr:class I SAM-dependent methyltransferase [Pedobacter sp. ok626]SDK52370.1 ubiE/COQ5 methyltransferase family protein [Pedobacter sp. ok626]
MNQELEIIRDQQQEVWNKFSAGWKKWDTLTMDFLKPVGDEMIRLLSPKNNDMVLDIASGTGEPGLTIAAMLTNGKVTLTDLSADMLEIARQNGVDRGIKNIETLVCDVSELPFEDNTFDIISCRFGFMFFPDMQLAAKEMARVLKPGGKVATSVWSIPEKNFWITASMGVIQKNMDIPAPPSGAPGMFRCAKAGMMSDLFKEAGLTDISEKEIAGKMNCGTTDTYWNLMTDIAAPVVAALSKADQAMKDKIKAEVYAAINQKYPDGNVIIDSSAIVVYAQKK